MPQRTEKNRCERMIYLDIIRILAVFAVIVIHISACEWADLPVASLRWQALNLYDAAARWCIPAFVMMSGRAFLDPRKTLKPGTLMKRNVLRMVISLLFWATAYHLYEVVLTKGTLDAADLAGGVIGVFTFSARRHLWFLYLMIGLYLLTPFLRRLTAGRSTRRLTLVSILLLLVSGITPIALSALPSYSYMQYVMQVPGFIGLFILGHLLERISLSSGAARGLCLAGLFGMGFTVAATSLLSLHLGTATQIFYSNTAPNVVITAVGLLVYGKRRLFTLSLGEKWNGRLARFSELTFTIYLIHDFFVIPLDMGTGGFSLNPFPPILSVFVFSFLVFCICTPFAYLICRIPILNRYIA
ncbi:MAG: acyltransferase [Acetanaerobacterium sp.]